MSRLWDRGRALDDAVLRLTVGRDPELDLRLLPHDCLASAAHAEMLAAIGVLTAGETAALAAELGEIAAAARAGTIAIDAAEEDGHTFLENRLTEKLGEAGRKIHTGRSRNDQVIAALRLWGRETVLAQIEALLGVVERLLDLAAEHQAVSLPGYTHTRQAMPTTLGHHFAAWAENLLDDVPWLETAFRHLNRSPLGSASGFGVALPLDRQRVADRLRFERLQVNTLAVQNDRGKSEYLALAAAAGTATDLGRLAADLIGFSSDVNRFVELAEEVTTGSSIMPQKRNPDPLELVRAGAARLRSRQAEVGAVYGGLTAGYHRDLQLTKEPFLEGMQGLVDAAVVMERVLATLRVDPERCRAAILPATAATDAVYERVAAGEPFRDAYREVAAQPEAAGAAGPETWQARTHAGAPGDPSIEAQHRLLAAARERLEQARAGIEVKPA